MSADNNGQYELQDFQNEGKGAAQVSEAEEPVQANANVVQGFVPVREFGAARSNRPARARQRKSARAQSTRTSPQRDVVAPSARSSSQEDTQGSLLVVLLAGVAVAVLGFFAGSTFLGNGLFSGFGTADPTVNPNETVVIIDSDTSEETNTDQTENTSVAIKESLSAYSWDELGTIAARIEQCTSSEDALAVAQEYNLIDASGTYYDATKSIDMLDGTTMKVRLVGIWHDNGDTVSGKTGLSFLADEVVYHQPMSSSSFMEGGWERSKLRAWLSSDLSPLFPTEVSSHFVSTYKRTNNVGISHSIDSVTETIDTLWVPSIVELAGPLDWVYSSHPEYRDEYNAIFNAEGTQYPAFAQVGINTDGTNPILSHKEAWWTRSTAPASSRSRYVGTDGNPAEYGDADVTRGVVVGFCF